MEDYKIIEVNDPNQMVDILKLQASTILSDVTEQLKADILPNREDFETEEEYEIIKRMTMMQLVDDISAVKKEVFCGILDTYNNFITEMNTFMSESKKQNKESLVMREYASYDMKKAGIITLGVSVIFPIAAPFLIVINLPRIGMDALLKKYHNMRLERNEALYEVFKSIQDPFYEFTNTLRSDYHASNKELKELKDKAIEGEDVLPQLIQIIEPERVGLQSTNLLEEQEEQKKLIKEIEKR